jgi:uracil-DNA glycosylase family 4
VATTVGHWKRDADCDVYVGRPSVWGNPYKVGRNGTREEVLQKYEEFLKARPAFVERARRELKGKKLGCWCKPKACHADILARYVDAPPPPLPDHGPNYVVCPKCRCAYYHTLWKEKGCSTCGIPLGESPVVRPKKILVTGDREWTDRKAVLRELRAFPEGTILVHGGCRGLDTIAAKIGARRGFVVREYKAKWTARGAVAGHERNAEMLAREHLPEEPIDLALAFHDDLTRSRGTADMVRKIALARIPHRVVKSRAGAPASAGAPVPSVPSVQSDGALKVPARQLPVYDPRAHGALCDECPLSGRVVVPPSPPTAPVEGIVVGMNPGAEEERSRRPFCGPSGRLLDRLLDKNDLRREAFHVTNAWLCRHRDEVEAFEASRCCRPRLHREIDSYDKSIPVMTTGKEAFQSAFGRKGAMTKLRGFQWKKEDGREFYPTVHPAFVLRDKIQFPLISRDFQRFAKRIHLGHLPLERTHYVYRKHTPRTLPRLRRLLRRFGDGIVACDIETTEEPPTVAELQCVGISDGRRTIVVPWQPEFKEPLAAFFKDRRVIFHNGLSFDTIVLTRYGIPIKKVEDTLIAHHTFASHFRQGLDHVASFYLDTIPWKLLYGKAAGDEKGVAKIQDERTFFKYNAIDVHHTFRVWQEMQKDLEPFLSLYKHDKRLAVVGRRMTRHGIRVDRPRRKELIKAITEKEERLVRQMREECGREDLVPTKVDDIRAILYEQFGAPVIERTEKDCKPSTGKKILQSFAEAVDRPYAKFCRDLVDWRTCTKMKKTYLVNLPIDKDGRVRPSWRSFGAYTGRFACRRPNLMNLKRMNKRYKDEPEQHIRSIYIPSKGCKFVTYDMSQVEPRVAAYISNDEAFIAAIETGDFHTNNAIVLFGECPELLDLKRAKDGDGKPKRDVAKSCGLAVNYLAEAPALKDFLASQDYFVKLSDIQVMIDRLRKKYHVYFKFVANNIELVQRQGWLRIGALSGRIRWLGFMPSPSRVADTPIQATAADIMNYRLIEIDQLLLDRGYYRRGVRIVAQIHDAVIFDVPEPLVEEIKQLIREVMGQKVKIGGKARTFPIDMKEGARWSEL